jgi:hypothetical protein
MVRDGDYVYTRTRHLGNKNGEVIIPDSVKAVFRNLGSVAIDTLVYQDLWIMATRFGSAGSTVEFVDPPSSGVTEIIEEFEPEFLFGEASVTSVPIGPARNWQSFGWQASNDHPGQSVTLDVLSGVDQSILVGGYEDPAEIVLSSFDPREHGLIRLRATLRDSLRLGTPQLTEWWVAYSPVAELGLDPSSATAVRDTILVGEPYSFQITAQNLGSVPADTAVVAFYVTNAANETELVSADTLIAFGTEASSSVTIESDGLVGTNTLRVNLEQPGLREAIQFNNSYVRSFVVEGDGEPPRFTVYVDGEFLPSDPDPVVNIQDPTFPFVSTRPLIEIDVEDDNPWRSLAEDSMTVSVSLDDRDIPFSQLEIVEDEDGNANMLRLRHQPDLTQSDSTHTLRVRVQDASGNESPNSPYQVHFRTQSDLEVESVYPYPNPMSTFTTFAFLLRGADAAEIDDFRVRVYTVTGRLVKEFDLVQDPSSLASGGLKIGWNKVNWDGRDDDGDRIATGVYLYKVFVGWAGESMSPTKGSEVEKLVVIR